MLKIYGNSTSGNCYKLKLLLAQLGEPFEWVEIDSVKGETRTPEYLAMNPNGKVPLLQVEPGKYLPESNAILCYLAAGGRYLPAERWRHAQVLQWLFFEQYSHEPYIAVARFIMKFLPADHPRRAQLPELRAKGGMALDVMEGHLAGDDFFAGSDYTIADIALYAYTHTAADGGFDLSRYPAINAWLARVRGQPGFVAM